jgi:phosphoribosylformimino-5-aminoimidazole carboxamide ribotide isomerase
MLLIIPTIDLQEDHCVRLKNDAYERETVYFDDPAKMARLWRLQNAKCINIVGHDVGGQCRTRVLKSICSAVDIPVQLQGGLNSMSAITSAIDAGVYRVIVDVHDAQSEGLLSEAIEKYGCSKIIAGLHAAPPAGLNAGESAAGAGEETPTSLEDVISLAGRLERTGCRRIVFSDSTFSGHAGGIAIDHIRQFGQSLQKARVTLADCVSDFNDLQAITAIKDARIDSIIMDRALYENAFSCQQFWCWNKKDELDLTKFSTAQLRNS